MQFDFYKDKLYVISKPWKMNMKYESGNINLLVKCSKLFPVQYHNKHSHVRIVSIPINTRIKISRIQIGGPYGDLIQIGLLLPAVQKNSSKFYHGWIESKMLESLYVEPYPYLAKEIPVMTTTEQRLINLI